jgi:hypothetical protein
MHSLTAHIVEPAGVNRRRWPITAGVPFAQGEIRSGDQIRLECDGQPSQCHWDVRARWPDGSVRWTLLDTQVDVAASSRTECVIHYGTDVWVAPKEPSPLRATETEDTIDVDTGVAKIAIGRSGYRLFTSFSIGGQALLEEGSEPQLIATTSSSTSPLHAEVEEAIIEECNPMRVVVRLRGHYVNEGTRSFGWIVRMHLFLNHSYVRLYHTILHDQPMHQTTTLNSLRLSLPLSLDEPLTALVGSFAPTESPCGPRRDRNPKARELTAPVGLLQTQPQHHQVSGSVPDGQRVQAREGNSFGWIHLADRRFGVTVKLIRPWQNGPMALSTDGSSMDVHLYPDLERPGLTAMDSTSVSGEKLPQGIAKTHELALHVGPPCTQFIGADRIAIGLEHPLLLSLPGEHWVETGVLGPFQIFAEDCWPLEAKLRTWSRVPSEFGFLEFGGCADPSEQRFGLARSLLLQYLRSHEQSLFWRAQALLFHEMDVGTCHFHAEHPEWIGGPYRPDQIGASAPSAEFARVDGLIDFYFLTGYRRAYEIAESCADFCRRNAPYDWRDELAETADSGASISGFGALPTIGNALNAMGTFFAAFPEERFLRSMEALVDLLEAWQDADGRWSHPIGLHRSGAEPAFTASVLEGLSQYHKASSDERARRMATDGALYLVHHGRTAEGLFFQQQSPSDLRPCARSLALLPALSETFERTGDSELLDAGLRVFRWAIHHDLVTAAHLKDLIAFMPVLENLKLLDEFRVPFSAVDRRREPWPHSVVSGDH